MMEQAVPVKASPKRSGPRPLPFHLNAMSATWLSSLAALPLARSGSLPWNKAVAAEAGALAPQLERADLGALTESLDGEIRRRLAAVLAGIEAYQAAPYGRTLEDPPALWQEGTSRLLDFGAHNDEASPPVLFVPSLINRAYILDLSEQRSLLRHLAARGLRPLLMDWGAPGEAERDFDLDDYIVGRLAGALEAVRSACGRRVVLVGYCMGGLLALPLALQRPDDVGALVLLATPWDFHAGDGGQVGMLGALNEPLRVMIAGYGMLPVDVIQSLFAGLDPMLVARKFARFATLAPDSAEARDFVALEDWLNDGVPLVGKVAEQCLFGWYGDNEPGRGRWRVGGAPVHPQRLVQPALNVVPARDRIVPPESAEPLSLLIPEVETWRPTLGHIGMIASPRAETSLWGRFADWLHAHADGA